MNSGSDETNRSPSRVIPLWIGPALTFVAAVSYFLFFVRFPALRDVPWFNLPLVLIGTFVAIAASGPHLTKSSAGQPKRVRAFLSAVAAVGMAGLFCFYVFSFSSSMPSTKGIKGSRVNLSGVKVQTSNKETVDLQAFAKEKLFVIFYRGYW